jgi:flagellar biosynthesis protein FlhG
MIETQSAPSGTSRTANCLIAVASGKGGVGKTWFAATLCHALANQGRKVLLFDGDLGLANVDVQLGLMPSHDLSSVLSGRRSLEGATINFPEGKFDIIAGQSGAGSLSLLPQTRLNRLRDDLTQYSTRYQDVVIDVGAGIDGTVQTLVGGAATALILTNDEPTSLTDAYALIKVMSRAQAVPDIQVVVNMASDHRQGEHTYQTILRACENFLKLSPPLAGIIRRDSHVADAIRHQEPLLTRYPNCAAAEDVAAIAKRIRDRS